jgi:hypothetical protein
MALISLWGHTLAALLFGALALWQLRQWHRDVHSRWLGIAFAVTAIWALSVALLGPHSMAAGLSESGRNFAFLGFMYAIVRR